MEMIEFKGKVCAEKTAFSGVEIHIKDKKFSLKDAGAFLNKIEIYCELESADKVMPFVFSRTGFTSGALGFFRQKGIAWSKDEGWLGDV